MNSARREVATALAGGIAAVSGSFALAGRTPAFVGAPASALLVDATPGVVVTTAIQRLGDWGHLLAFAVALALTVGLFASLAFVGIRLGARSEVPYTTVVAGGLPSWTLAFVATGAPDDSLGAAFALAAVLAIGERRWAVGRHRPNRHAVSTTRRKTLTALATLAGFVGLSVYRGQAITGVEPGPISDVTDEQTQAEADDLLARTDQYSLDWDALGGLVTPTDGFYEVDVNNVNPNPSDGTWDLTVTGEVGQETTVDFATLTGMDASNTDSSRFGASANRSTARRWTPRSGPASPCRQCWTAQASATERTRTVA